MLTVLHLDDDPLITLTWAESFAKHNVAYKSVPCSQDFFASVAQLSPDIVIVDLQLEITDLSGQDVLTRLKQSQYAGLVLVASSLFTPRLITSCLRLGAFDYMLKDDSLVPAVFVKEVWQRFVERSTVDHVNLPKEFSGTTMQHAANRLKSLVSAQAVKSVLVTGESGTGKEVIATMLQNLLVKGTPFVAMNCGAIAKDLLEAELFGHERGAFTGANTRREGLFSKADGGWIFLDEVARLSLPCQAALLRALESGEIRPVGSSQNLFVKIRVLAATNENLDQLVEQGQFRGDLLQRIRTYEIVLPPLRERSGEERSQILDVLLTRLNNSQQAQGLASFTIAPSVRRLFLDAPWKRGNVREMWQTLLASSVDASQQFIGPSCLPASFLDQVDFDEGASPAASARVKSLTDTVDFSENNLKFTHLLLRQENKMLQEILNFLAVNRPATLSSQRKLAQVLGLSRHALTIKLQRLVQADLLADKFRHLVEQQPR